MTATLRVVAAGPATTLQDTGRKGAQQWGVAPCGAADRGFFGLANALVGNGSNGAALEFTACGPVLQAGVQAVLCAVVGDTTVHIDGRAVAAWRAHWLEPGQTLAVGALRTGWRGYVAVGGGIAAAPILGSRAQHCATGVGPLAGGPLREGDELPCNLAVQRAELAVDPQTLPRRDGPIALLWTPDSELLASEQRQQLVTGPWHVDLASDRMAVGLLGPQLDVAATLGRLSQPTVAGGIQIAGDGHPRILLADRQTVGGYVVPAAVASVDHDRLAQLRPGHEVPFAAINLEVAFIQLAEYTQQWTAICANLRQAWPPSARTLLGHSLD